MKKVLIVGYIWPYHRAAGNCVHAVAKYLPEFGWEPVVLTIPLPEKPELKYRVIEVPYYDLLNIFLKLLGFDTSKSIKKQVSQKLDVTSKRSFLDFVFLRLREVTSYPDSIKGWKTPAIEAGSELLQKEDIRAIISDCPPVMGNLISKELKVKYNIPWIVYFSHLWSQNNGYPYSSLRRMFDTRLELKTFSKVDVMITHSEPLAAKLRKLHKGKQVFAVNEGFDPETVNTPPDKLTDMLTITYTGSFAPVLREPTKLFAALQNLLSRGIIDRDRIEVRFYGPEEIWIDSDINKYGLSGIVKQYGKVPMDISHEKQRESQLLFNPKWDDPREPGIYSGKIFEYLAARRPILATGKYKDVVDELLDETGAGVCATSEEDVEYALEKMYREYMEKGEVVFRGDTSKIDKYSHREFAGKFAETLNHLTELAD